MPSSRSAPVARPSSPMSPRGFESSRYDSLQPPSRSLHGRPSSSQQQRRNQAASLMLPALPRFHPANFPSNHSSATNTPGSGPASPNAPLSPQRIYSDAQKQMFLYRETLAGRASSTMIKDEPVSPKLAPAGSPGPVTPLELEEGDGYLATGYRAARHRATHSDGASEFSAKLSEGPTEMEGSLRAAITPGRR